MTHAKLKAGEVAGTYLVTSPVTETDIITMPSFLHDVNSLKAVRLHSPRRRLSTCRYCFKITSTRYLVFSSSIVSTVLSALRSYSVFRIIP